MAASSGFATTEVIMPVALPARNRLWPYTGGVTEAADRRLGLVLDFLNTVDIEAGADELRDRTAFGAWLGAHGFPDGADLDAARRFRTVLRAAVGDRPPGERSMAGGVPVQVTVGPDGRPALTAADPLGQIAAAAVRLVDDGRWDRVKICSADDCRWAFYDRSKNHSRHWCSMGVCGNRAKSRTFRERRRAGGT